MSQRIETSFDPYMVAGHVELLRPDGGDLIVLTKSAENRGFHGRRYLVPDQIEEIANLADEAAERGSPVYYVPAIVSPEWDTNTTPRKEHIVGSPFAILDVDVELFVRSTAENLSEEEISRLASEHYDRERERTLQLPPDLPPPTITVSTGGGTQFLWASDQMLSPTQYEAVNLAILRKLTEHTGCKPKDTACWNSNRLLRLAGTWNPKCNDYRVPRMAELVS